jgi:lipopolysaccharide/colanic/teichoic acid biosynthesis glycosyltransferase
MVGLLLTSPILACAAIAIKVADRGPILYKQERVGKNGRPFTILKLRTMTVGAEHTGLGLSVAHNDSRITVAGSVLRATSVDELPQLINVLRGEMSLVGPRPTVASQVERYNREQLRRLEVKPGLTGWAQISGRNTLSWPERIGLDIWYVDNRSLWLDIKIIARTPKALFNPVSLYGPSGINTGL